MFDIIPVPASSKWGAAVARRLNSFSPIAPAGALAMTGPTGTGFSAPPVNQRDRRATVTSIPRPFDILKIVPEEVEEGARPSYADIYLRDGYYRRGGLFKSAAVSSPVRLYYVYDDEEEDEDEGEEEETNTNNLICYRVLEGTSSSADDSDKLLAITFDELSDLSKDLKYTHIPLWRFDLKTMSPDLDLRFTPTANSYE